MRARATEFSFFVFCKGDARLQAAKASREGRALYPVSAADFYIPCALPAFISHVRCRTGKQRRDLPPRKIRQERSKNTIFWQIRLFGVIPRQKAFCGAYCTKRMLARVRFFGTIWYLQSLFSVLQLGCKENSQHSMQREKGEK